MPGTAGGWLDELQRDLAAIDGGSADRGAIDMLFAKYQCATVTELRGRIESLRRTENTLRSYTELFEAMRGESWFVFMNHGYLPPEDERCGFPPLRDDDEAWRHQVFLYFHLLTAARACGAAVPFADCALLDVGCGRGGGVAALQRHYSFRSAAGLDLNPLHVAFCRERHPDSLLAFIEGNAQEMPFDDESFDLVTSVEASHCFPDVAAFAREARRVLRPGGFLLLTDTRADAEIGASLLELELLTGGLTLLDRQDITDRVRAACELDAERFRTVFPSAKAEFPRSIAEDQARRYASGVARYLVLVARK